ncbi:H-NS histone family protein [Xanthomonas vasicola]|uniref:H-NS histone family protein n=1 Tax=Xanthomonas vasicola TaxID=56459 RepID=UPI0001CC0477|nr:H-NS family nucleoid-associated regulatory protein [Xanthomonas vasicola]KFA39879.1 histone-like nucleoid-structuring protein [Xanthomonas vasicola pv. musacearum NCPPB 4384]AZR30118.1 histone-like nucleoid-structuring protein [Xanthomonas vasicola pv. musacearum NCPPB 4379]KFA09477.1 histone-like nucleoid-structuring protein [Xanthomonas vasicola pv. musacearum NCPPB 2005]KFA15854.1 histone-like nucleoid-structuring protein [Xanthomonas vasicola pv. musacearum NCPPB 4380]KFA17222.1 histone
MSKPTLDSIASAKAKLAEELKKLEEQEATLLVEEASSAFLQVSDLLSRFGQHFTAKQKAELAAQVGSSIPVQGRPKKAAGTKKEVAPKYWLPHTQETWTGRGRTPRSFAAWEGSAAYKEWKAKHPDEKFPKFPG